jgi:hypothetical protein
MQCPGLGTLYRLAARTGKCSHDHYSDVGATIFSGEASEVLFLAIQSIPNLLVFLCVLDVALILMRQVHIKDERNP